MRALQLEYPGGNRILDALPIAELDLLRPLLTNAAMELRIETQPANAPIEQVHFPLDSILSVVALMGDGSAMEVGTIGNEGAAGLQVVLETAHGPFRTMCQLAGKVSFMDATALKHSLASCPRLHRLLLRFANTSLNVLGQTVACNRLHPIVERCARWLLMTQDRVDADTFLLTQEFLAMMLGVRRAGVSVAAAALQEAGFIHYSRGAISVRNRAGLESASCECYRFIAAQFDETFAASSTN